MYISGAKFKDDCFIICRDILDWVLYSFSGPTYDVITVLICIYFGFALWRNSIGLKNFRHFVILKKQKLNFVILSEV